MITTIHSYWAYVVLLMLIIATVNALVGLTQKSLFTDKNLRIFLFTLIVAHIQLIIGIINYFTTPYFKLFSDLGMGGVMKSSQARLLLVEHPLIMIIAIALITIGWSKHKKKTTDHGKFKTIAIFYGIALLLILSRIPWNQWFTAQ